MNYLKYIGVFVLAYIATSLAVWWLLWDEFNFTLGESSAVVLAGYFILLFKEGMREASNYYVNRQVDKTSVK